VQTITLNINGKNISCTQGTSILEAAENHGIKIPKLCYHHSLAPAGACRLCLVEDGQTGRLLASCVTPATQDMTIQTQTPGLIKHRQNIVSLMMSEHPESCIVCSKGNRCQLRQIAADLGIGDTRLYPMPNFKPLEQANPFIMRDLSKCILCGKCIRADHELVVTGAIDYSLRGFESRPATVHELPLEHSNCTFCGTCVSMCPTGALSAKTTYVGTPERESNSICGFCGVGCCLTMGAAGGQVVEVNPAHFPKSVNDSTLCVRGHFAHDFLNSKKRLTRPLVRKENELEPVSWDDALKVTAERLSDISKKYGPQSIALLGSSKCTNEENYLFQKIGRAILKTNSVDNGGYFSGRLFLSMVDERTDRENRFSFFAGPLSGLEQAEAVFVLGTDPGQSAPVVNYYLKRGAGKGVPLVVANPVEIGLSRFSSVWLHPTGRKASGDNFLDMFYLELINGLSALLLEDEAVDAPFISRFTDGFEDYRESLSSLDLESNCQKAGLDLDSLKKTAAIFRGKKIAFVVGDGIFLQRYGMETMEALLNLSLMTGSIGYKGAGLHIMAKENNQVGAWDMGTVPDALPGRLPLANEENRKLWEHAWQTKISPDPGLDLIQIIKGAEAGKLKALYILGENPLLTLPQGDRVLKAIEKIDFVVVQDILFNQTAAAAHVVLPGAAFSEKEGSFTNMEGLIQSFSRVVPPPGNARPDLEILGHLADKMGHPEFKTSPEEIRKEIGRILPEYAGAGRNQHAIWIREFDDNTKDYKGEEKKICFSSVTSAKKESPDEAYPFTAILGPLRYHLGGGTRTGFSERIQSYNAEGEIELSPADCSELDLGKKDSVRLVSPTGTIERKISENKNLLPGYIFVPLAVNGNDARNLVPLTPLSDADSSGWDSCQVKVEKISSLRPDDEKKEMI